MRAIIAVAMTVAVVALTAAPVQAQPYHHRHHHQQVCTWHHHHKVCHWR